MKSNFRNSRPLRPSFIVGIRGSHCQVVPGGMNANYEHFEKLLSDAGMTPPDFEALYAKTGAGESNFIRMATLRAELSDRGILPIVGRNAAPAAVATAPAAGAAPADLLQVVCKATEALTTLSAALPGVATHGAAAAMVPAGTSALRAEMKAIAHKLDATSIARKAQLLRTIRQMESGTFDAGKPARAVLLRAELVTLRGRMDDASTRRKGSICAELRAA